MSGNMRSNLFGYPGQRFLRRRGDRKAQKEASVSSSCPRVSTAASAELFDGSDVVGFTFRVALISSSSPRRFKLSRTLRIESGSSRKPIQPFEKRKARVRVAWLTPDQHGRSAGGGRTGAYLRNSPSLTRSSFQKEPRNRSFGLRGQTALEPDLDDPTRYVRELFSFRGIRGERARRAIVEDHLDGLYGHRPSLQVAPHGVDTAGDRTQ